MSLDWLRRRCSPIALATVATFLHGSLHASLARAQSAADSPAPAAISESDEDETPSGSYDESTRDTLAEHVAAETGNATVSDPSASLSSLAQDVDRALASLPSAAGVSPQAAALPSGAATQLGMGESFTAQLSSGTAAYGVPIALPSARGRVQPRLDLSYSSGGGFGLAGVGWSIGASAISRQTDRGVPSYDDRVGWHPQQDRFVFGGTELVPICTVVGVTCAGVLPGEAMPSWANGWQYFRSRIEGGFLRFFWSPDHRTWRVQGKEGTNMELGVPLDGTGYQGALERNPDAPEEIFRWHLVRQYDTQLSTSTPALPVNVVVYRHTTDGDAVYLTDIFDTSPASNPTTTNLNLYAHHTRIAYEPRPDVAQSLRAGYPARVALRVKQIDVTSKPYSGINAARELLRRYHLSYDATSHRSLLTAVQMEGRCGSAVTENSEQALPSTQCPRLPPVSFAYEHTASSRAPLYDSQGYAFEPFVHDVRDLASSPPHSLDEPHTGLADINADGLPDVLVTAASFFDGNHGLYLNASEPGAQLGFGRALEMPVEPAADVTDAGVLSLSSPTVSALDLDSDGTINLVHMPTAKRYAVFTPERVGTSGFKWVGRSVHTASEQDVKIDFTRDANNISVMDVNGDGLVDIAYSSATEIQTFFSLGRHPQGDGQFGRATATSASTSDLRNDPVVFCIPWSSTPVRFSDPDTKVADMNGDGLADIVRVRPGQVLYWPGRGNGFWGLGDRANCSQGFAESRHVEMAGAPQFGTTQPGTLLLNDVNGDGLADMVEVRNQGVDIYLNDNGSGWTERHIIDHTPFRPSGSNYVRLTDINGSGTPDILWGAAYQYQYIDLTGGKTPGLLTEVRNGLGKTAELQYASSTDVMRTAAAAGQAWTSFAPTAMPVLVRSIVRDNLSRVGRAGGNYITEYSYRNPVYEGRQREFRGFSEALVKTVGDANSPTSFQRTVFELGECSPGSGGVAPDVCTAAERWQDNWREPLKGLPLVTEVYDEQDVFKFTEHSTYELRQLYTGLDGRRVSVALPLGKDAFLYDISQFVDGTGYDVALDDVRVNLTGITHNESANVRVRATPGTARVRSESTYDNFGNVTRATAYGCVSGCPNGPDEAVMTHSEYALATGDSSGWLWREQRSYVTGSSNTARVREHVHTYNRAGDLEASYALLSGTLALDRRHAAGGSFAPAPPTQSGGMGASVQILVVDHTYDMFGHATFTRSANNHCSSNVFDLDYAQLTVISSVRVGPLDTQTSCGARVLTHKVAHDRGLEAVISSTDPTSQPSEFKYDGFGRFLSARYANPSLAGSLATYPSVTVEYQLPQDSGTTPYSVTVVRTQDGISPNVDAYSESRVVQDGLGRQVITLTPADRTAGDPADWIAKGAVAYDAKGAVARSYEPVFHTGTLSDALRDPPAGTPYKSQEYDAFGTPVRSYGLTRELEALVVPHTLSTDTSDAADYYATPHQGTFATVVSDGHGRGVRRVERIKVGSQLEQREIINDYLPTGEVYRVRQARAGSTDVVRWMKYDSLGRMVLNVEPNTSTGFNANPATPPDQIKAWRYAYDDSGAQVGFSDARGCGANYHYDTGGRVIAEDRSPCQASQAPYSAPNLGTGDGTETFYRYDAADPDTGTIVDAAGQNLGADSRFLWGRLVSVSGLGAKVINKYDALGRGLGVAVRVQKPGVAATTLGIRYAARWYIKTQTLDAANRPITASTGVTLPELNGNDGTSELRFTYGPRGYVTQIGSSYGILFAGGQRLADGRVQSIKLGDAAGTERYLTYDAKQRVQTAQTYRTAPPLWTNPPVGSGYTPPAPGSDPTLQLLLQDDFFTYDQVGNIIRIEDHRIASEWPVTAKPLTRNFEYDDLYRLTRTSYEYAVGSTDSWKSPYDYENQHATAVQPSPHVKFDLRPTEQRFQYDWLGNITQSTDDQHAFWDRSTGNRIHGSTTSGPHQLRSATNRILAPSSPRKGDLSAAYDAVGNLTGLIVRRDGACLPTGASCWQRFEYGWNEVGELVRARRWDLSTSPNERSNNGQLAQPVPPRTADAELNYHYDGSGGRALKTAIDKNNVQKHTVYVFNTLELRSTDWGATNNDYVLDASRVSVRLFAGPVIARVLYSLEDMPTLSSGRRHIFVMLQDQLGSTPFLIDHATGELVEHSTYLAYGAVETNYRPGRWQGAREPYKFSGKEEDIELGLSYFGARYYSPYLNAWVSADPITIHSLGSDTNPYAYVRGMPVMAVDPNGEELVTILVAVGIGLAIGAAVGGGTAITVQAVHGRELNDMDWGIKGVGGAILVGAVSGAVSGGFGALGSGLLNATVSGALASMSGQGVGYLSGQNKGEHFWENVAGGAVAGAVGGGFAGLADGACTECVVTGLVTGPAAGYGSSAFLSGDEVTGEGLALALGGSLAGAAANYGAAYAVQEISSNPLDNQRVRAALQDAYRDSGYDGTQIHTNDWGQGSRNRYTPGPGHEISGTIDPAPGGSFKVERSPMGDTLGRHRNRSPGHGQGHLLGFHTHPPDGDPAPSGIKKGKDGDVPLAIHTSTPEIVVSESEVWEATASGEKKYLGARESVLAVGRAIDVWVPAVVATQAARDADRWCVRGPGCR